MSLSVLAKFCHMWEKFEITRFPYGLATELNRLKKELNILYFFIITIKFNKDEPWLLFKTDTK